NRRPGDNSGNAARTTSVRAEIPPRAAHLTTGRRQRPRPALRQTGLPYALGSLRTVANAPDPTLLRIRHVQRAIRPDGQTHRSITRVARAVVGHLARKAVGQYFVG